jgi:di/tricarboxylate transporter
LIGTSTNLIIAGLIISAGLPALNIFTLALVGVPAALIGIAFLITIGNRLLPEDVQGEVDFAKRRYKAEFLVFENSPLIGKTILESGIAEAPGYQLVEFEHADIGSNPQEQGSRPASIGLGLFHRLTRTWRARPEKGLRKPEIDKPEIDL